MKIWLTRERRTNGEKSPIHVWFIRPLFNERWGIFYSPNAAARDLCVEIPLDMVERKIRPGEILTLENGR